MGSRRLRSPAAPPPPPPRWGGPGGAALTATIRPAADVPTAAPPPAPAMVREAGGAFADLWANLLLYLGAFFVVMAALIFVAYSWRSLGGTTKAAIMLGFTAAFLGAGAACLRAPRVRPAGHTFLAISALLTPL